MASVLSAQSFIAQADGTQVAIDTQELLQKSEKQITPDWLNDMSNETYHEEVRSLEKKNKITNDYISLYKSQSEYLELLEKVSNQRLAQERSAKLRARLGAQGLNPTQDNQPQNFRMNSEYQAEVNGYLEQIQALSLKISDFEDKAYKKAANKRNDIIENSFDNLYLVSVYGPEDDLKAEFFYRGGRLQSHVGDELPGGWKILAINTTRALVYNGKADVEKEREINFKDPQTVKEEIRIKREIDMEIMKKQAEVDGQILLEQQKRSGGVAQSPHDSSRFTDLQNGR